MSREVIAEWLSIAVVRVLLAVVIVVASIAVGASNSTTARASSTVVIDGEDGTVIRNLKLTSPKDCLVIRNATKITIVNSEIGPCGGKGIDISNSNGVRILDSYIHPEYPVSGCCDRGDAIFAATSSDLLLQGNVIAYGETNVELMGVTGAKVTGNFLLNPLGPFPRGGQVQAWSIGSKRSSNIEISENYTLATRDGGYTHPEGQWDAINIGLTDGAVVKNNYIVGGHSHSGCGIIADNGANSVKFLNNTLVNTGQCGIGIGSGTNQVVDSNRILNNGVDLDNAGNTALYVWKQYQATCGPVTVTNNVAVLKRPNGALSSYWDGGGCGPITFSGNTFDQNAIAALSPIESKYPPPQIPPLAFTRRATSPYSTPGQ